MNAKANTNKISGFHARVKNLTDQVGAQDIGGYGHILWTCGGDHVQANYPRKKAGGTT